MLYAKRAQCCNTLLCSSPPPPLQVLAATMMARLVSEGVLTSMCRSRKL